MRQARQSIIVAQEEQIMIFFFAPTATRYETRICGVSQVGVFSNGNVGWKRSLILKPNIMEEPHELHVGCTPSRGSVLHFIFTTTPLVAVLIYFLHEAKIRPSKAIYNLGDDYTDDQLNDALEERLIALYDILTVFLSVHVLWTTYAVYIIVFVAKRRHFIGRYLSEGERVSGDVIFDKSSRNFGGFHDYGYTVYAHPTQRKVIRKRVRVYQRYTREKVTILRLPKRPLSGQPKTDIEIDLSLATKERDNLNTYIGIYSGCWVVFTFACALFVLQQMFRLEESASSGLKTFLVIVGLNIPFAFIANWIRFLLYRNWMINRGAVVDDDQDARKVRNCLDEAQSEDGSDVIPYSLLNEEELSYQGSLPSISNGSIVQDTTTEGKKSGPPSFVLV